jgi:hypothetical protein
VADDADGTGGEPEQALRDARMNLRDRSRLSEHDDGADRAERQSRGDDATKAFLANECM